MADEGIADGNVFDDLSCFVWGSDLNEDNFKRWSQGFVFSQDEPSALVQLEGGPCAVIASVQAHLIKNVLFCDGISKHESSGWRQITAEQATDLLARTLCQMLQMVKADDNIALVLMKDHPPCLSGQESQEKSQKMPDSTEFSNYHKTICQQSLRNLTSKDLHSSLRSIKCRNIEETRSLITRNTNIFESHFGVLLFLYSIILTRGIDTIKQEMEDSNEPLVDPDFGHGSQTLINLLITGYGVSHIWDHSKNIASLELRGIPKQCNIGFLTLLEAHRYCEVGSFLKGPEYPIWLLGSETHLSVLFSTERDLSGTEQPVDKAKRVFKAFDQQENGFIDSSKLIDVLAELNLETDPDYVEFMRSRLDPDSVGIILLPNFLDDFFPRESSSLGRTSPFTVFHYNGLGMRTDGESTRKVIYTMGIASIEPTDFSSVAELDIVTCLKTKWPGLSVEWQSKYPPTLN
ncbi:ubiquitin carboxyl-terminal hydrolase MINDY-3 [Nematostella vectensis]|uniref:ubiquitin carboxyl-terminal hydrolase MINDY-3 n=1 Tax=Nematostella vectensis TaxID=45351 RepID=UPI00207789CB|nr:ubiquitin carboxyl-terminal hydrolase MINDY-3 [Nematostella vectensis]